MFLCTYVYGDENKDTVKPVYNGHLGEIDKMTTIYR